MKILVLGDIIVDLYTYGKVDRLAPDFAGFIFEKIKTVPYLGGAGNVARNIKALLPDATVDLMGSIGPDYEFLCSGLNLLKHGSVTMVKERLVAVYDDQPDETKVKQKLIRIDTVKSFSNPVMNIPQGYDYIVISDYNKGTISRYASYGNYNPGQVFVDSKKHDLTCYPRGSIVKINRSEYEASKDRLGDFSWCLVTNGKRPTTAYHQAIDHTATSVFNVPTYDVSMDGDDTIDFSGAGDSFLAGFISSYVKGSDVETSIKIGNIAAAIAITQFGTTCVTHERLEEEKQKAKEYLE